ncbi:GntR family transcriptional regulator [Mobilicoccus massiliensis]|uniref:GntR family transcriptional regulator n=1 Tax=Mobilicoccus massiliensis TaxID=1522310 RepID=UPI000694C4A0|nr:GntR family transcriptional regulator [Mobilicoccus massiliensis]
MPRRSTLATRVAEDLRSEIAAGEYAPGDRLPTEHALSARFQVSRPTVRTALQELEGLGLVRTRHGVGTFVVEQPAVRAGLERLESMTDAIRNQGHEPGMVYASRLRRPLVPEEAARMGLAVNTEVLELRRSILADGEVVAYSYDLLPWEMFPDDFDPSSLTGSIFEFMSTRLGVEPATAVAEVHAVYSEHVGWGPEAAAHRLFVLLNQLHYDASQRLVAYSRTYFIEGRYSFTIYRTPSGAGAPLPADGPELGR